MARYWRVSFRAMQPSINNAFLTLCTMHTVSGGPNVCVGGSPFSNIDVSASYPIGNLFIDNTTYWLAATFFQTIPGVQRPESSIAFGYAHFGYLFPTDIEISEIYVRSRDSTKLGDIFVQSSVNGVDWVNRAYLRDIDMVANTMVPISIPSSFDIALKALLSPKLIVRKPDEYIGEKKYVALPKKGIYKQHSGTYKIDGTTTVEGVRVARQVYLMKTMTGEIIEGQWSGEKGEYEFPLLKMDNYTVLAVDRSQEQNSIVFSHVTPVAE